ncbi:MAG TPA: hypothetical protein VG941_02295 [Candidatus Paceibacterota bacterium]|nr:hypothetical protein [Candidatus Paceibacterota bacterium]
MSLFNWHRPDLDFERLKHYERKLTEQEEYEIAWVEIEEILIHVNHCALKLKKQASASSPIVLEDRQKTILKVLELLDRRGVRVKTLS